MTCGVLFTASSGLGWGRSASVICATDAGLLLIPVCEGGLTGDGLLCGESEGNKRGSSEEGNESGELHDWFFSDSKAISIVTDWRGSPP
jgi:hypothetical protein